jgi:ribosomal protein S18 acetylase RimI-like enzyme
MSFAALPLEARHASFIAEVLTQDIRVHPVQSLIYAHRSIDEARGDYERQFATRIRESGYTRRYRWLRAVDTNGANVAWAQWEAPRMHWAEEEGITEQYDPTRNEKERAKDPNAIISKTLSTPASYPQTNKGQQDNIDTAPMRQSEAWTNFGRQWNEKDKAARDVMLQGRTSYWGESGTSNMQMEAVLTRFAVLCNIGTHRSYRKQGAATLLTSWAFAEADRERLPIIVHAESAGQGLPLYRKLGFEEGTRFEMDLRPLGGNTNLAMVCLIREPR